MSKPLPWLPDNFAPSRDRTAYLGAPQRKKSRKRAAAKMDAMIRSRAKRRSTR